MYRTGSTLSVSSGPPSCSWKNWVLGTLISIILPFWRHKWTPLLALKKEVVMVVETIDVVTEVVEKAAEGVEEIAHSVAESLPDGGLQKAACLVEQAAKKVAEEAHAADEFIHKVEETGKEIEKEVEAIVEAVIEEERVENEEVAKDEVNK
ncbi:hypothetical protein Sjap_018817 [Stephania japonica]|uniref:Uncharacterized protein n=1 Tax=Stephania japonica TaxID=461633 RepID=A0AAP0I8U0_9MAGN